MLHECDPLDCENLVTCVRENGLKRFRKTVRKSVVQAFDSLKCEDLYALFPLKKNWLSICGETNTGDRILDIFIKNSGYLEQIDSQKSGGCFSVKNCHVEILLNHLVPWIVDVGVRYHQH